MKPAATAHVDKEQNMTEVEKLKQMAIDRYNEDGGVMYECSEDKDYESEIKQHGTAEAAWAWNLRIVEAQKETQACYEVKEW
jgi:hypothetical protein